MTVQSAFEEWLKMIGIFWGLVWYLMSGIW